MSVREKGVAPVDCGAHVQVHAEARPASYLHLVWIDSRGQATPLHPWKPGDWGQISSNAPRGELVLPPGGTDYWAVDGPAGIQSVVLAASRQPLELQTLRAVRECWGGLVPEEPSQILSSWQEYEGPGQPEEFRLNLTPKKRPDPMRLRHQTIVERLQAYFAHIKLLSFASRGKSGKSR